MFLRAIPERALGALLGGGRGAGVLHQHMTKLWQRRASDATTQLELHPLRNALRKAISEDIDERTGLRHRMNEAQQAASDICEPPFLDQGEIPAFDDVIGIVLACDADDLHFREEQVQRYAEVLSELDPTLLVAWHLVKRTEQSGQNAARMLQDAVPRLTTLFVGPRFLSAPVAEGHVHFGGIVGGEFVLARLVLEHQWPSRINDQESYVVRLRRIRRMLMAFTSNWKGDDEVDVEERLAREAALVNACPDDAQPVAPNPTVDWDFLQRGIFVPGGRDVVSSHLEVAAAGEGSQAVTNRWLLQQLATAAAPSNTVNIATTAAAAYNLESAWVWLFILLWRTYREKAAKPATRVAVLLLVADLMVLRRTLAMDGSGLRRFSTQSYHAPLRRAAATHEAWPEASSREMARRLFAGLHDKAEIKIAASAVEKSDGVTAFARAAHARINALAGSGPFEAGSTGVGADDSRSRSHWHFCAHFNRVVGCSRAALWKEAEALRSILYSAVPWDLASPFGAARDPGPGHLVLPAQLVRGLDVVGDETRWPIEMFAPMLRWLRLQKQAHPVQSNFDKILPPPELKLHLSIHAGEDYAHPLSGLRHINETVRFCSMRAGDRLGHALALGIPPDEWLHRHGDVLLSVDDHFDNLVWAWREALRLAHLKEARTVRPRLEARIARVLQHVSWYPWKNGMPALTHQDLMRFYEAWKLRRNCAQKALEQIGNIGRVGIGGPDLRAGVPDLSRLHEQFMNPSVNSVEGLYVLRARREVGAPTASKKPLRQVRLIVLRHGHVTRRQTHLESLDAQALKTAKYIHDHDNADDLRFMLALQDACIERYARLGLSIETNPSSNVYIGQLETHSDHPIYRWDPPNDADLKAGAKFNQFGLRKRRMHVTINSDDPGIVPTTLRMEYHLMHEAAIDRGYEVPEADVWIEKLRLRGIEHFQRAH